MNRLKLFGRDKPKLTKVISGTDAPGVGIDEDMSNLPPPVFAPNPYHYGEDTLSGRASSESYWEPASQAYDDPYAMPGHGAYAPPISSSQPPSSQNSFSSAPLGPPSTVSSPAPVQGPGTTPTPPPAAVTAVAMARSPSPFSTLSNNTSVTPSQRTARPDRSDSAATNPRKRSPPSASGPAALGILKALDPHQDAYGHVQPQHSVGDLSEDSHSTVPVHVQTHGPTPSVEHISSKERKERKGWLDGMLRDRERDRDRDRVREGGKGNALMKDRREEEQPHEITRMIGYLTATASEDWSLVLEVCERASANETNAKEAVKALRREFKYAEPSAQLSAARLWAIMLRNASETLLNQISSRKFIDTLEEVLTSSRTSPVVRERLMEVLAAAAYIFSSRSHNVSKDRDKDGFRQLWTRLKPADKPDGGIPFDNEDVMFSPPVINAPSQWQYSQDSLSVSALDHQQQPHQHQGTPPSTAPLTRSPTMPIQPPPRKKSPRGSRGQNQIIPPDEDIRRLFQECKIARGNAHLLASNLLNALPEDIELPINREFYQKCRLSQELIYTQIPWASSGAERSRAEAQVRNRSGQNGVNAGSDGGQQVDLTIEERLLEELLGANSALLDVLRMYDDYARLMSERHVEERSKREVRHDPRQQPTNGEYYAQDDAQPSHAPPPVPPRTPSPSPPGSPSPRQYVPHGLPAVHPNAAHPLPMPPNLASPTPHHPPVHYPVSPPAQTTTPTMLAPPMQAHPIGPRSPMQQLAHSRSPSLEKVPGMTRSVRSESLDNGVLLQKSPPLQQQAYVPSYVSAGAMAAGHPPALQPGYHDVPEEMERLRVGDGEEGEEGYRMLYRPSEKALGKRRVIEDPEEYATNNDPYSNRGDAYNRRDSLSDSDSDYAGVPRPKPHYVYDAAAERTAQRLRNGRVSMLVNGVH